MKKIFIFFIFFLFSFLFLYQVNAGGCYYDGEIGSSLSNCLSDTTLVKPGNLDIKDGEFNSKIYNITKTIASVLALGAIFGIVYGSFLLVTAGGEDEKIKKGKDVIKWSIIGFLGVVLASSLIILIVTFFYDI